MKKIMYCASTFSHITNFHLPYIGKLVEEGYEVIVVAGGEVKEIPYVKKCEYIAFEKRMISLSNIKNIIQLTKLIKFEKFDVISVHTSLAAALVRVSLFFVFNKPYVINTVHGYLFGKAYGKVKNGLYLGIEKLLKLTTDTIIVMNEEDYKIADKYRLYKTNLYKVDGMGVDLEKFNSSGVFNRPEVMRERIGFSSTDIIMIFVGEFSNRKNQIFLIQALKSLPKHYKLLFVGTGEEQNTCKMLAREEGTIHRIVFEGYQSEVAQYYKISDICVSASRSEGLPFNILEAMACGLPVVASDVKGHNDIVEEEWLFRYGNLEEFVQKVKKLDVNTRRQVGKRNKKEVQKYDVKQVVEVNYQLLRCGQ